VGGWMGGSLNIVNSIASVELIIRALEEGGNLDLVYLYFTKTYDKVDLSIMMRNIRNLGLTGCMVYLLIALYLNVRVNENGSLLDAEKILSVIPQGSVLGTILFLIFIEDITDN